MGSKKINEDAIKQQTITSSNLNDFMTVTFKILFQQLKLPSGFYKKDPDVWNDDNDFFRASSIAQELKEVNNHVERAVALIQDYCGLITKHEQQLQFFLEIVQEHRKIS